MFNQSFSLFLVITAGYALEAKILNEFAGNGKSTKSREIFRLFSNKKNQKQTLSYALRTVGSSGVANNLNDVSHLPHLAESFLILF